MSTPLSRERKRRKLTALCVATELQLNQSYLSRIERGQAKPSAEMAEKLSRFYGGNVTELQILYPERFPECRTPETAGP